MTAYTTSAEIAAYLGATFTPSQVALADDLAIGVTAQIDTYTGRTWQQSGAIADELHTVQGTSIWLLLVPVASLDAVDWYDPSVGWTPLTSDQYALVDAASGQVQISGHNRDEVRADYTTAISQAPADIQLAATILASSAMVASMSAMTAGMSSLSLGQNDIAIQFAGAGVGSTARADVALAMSILNGHRRVAIA